jgi:hypothetical protein
MKKTIAATALAAGVLAGAGVALTAPGIALAADSTTTASSATDRAAARLTAIKDALKGLVTDGTISQAQADKVATALSQAPMPFGGPGGRGRGPRGVVSPEATASALGITVDQLRTAQLNGRTLTQIAADHGISKAQLVSKLVAAARTRLAADLKAGTITRAQYDAALADLQARITEHVDQVCSPGRGGLGGPGDGDGDGPPTSTAPTAPAPTDSASASPST